MKMMLRKKKRMRMMWKNGVSDEFSVWISNVWIELSAEESWKERLKTWIEWIKRRQHFAEGH